MGGRPISRFSEWERKSQEHPEAIEGTRIPVTTVLSLCPVDMKRAWGSASEVPRRVRIQH
jgi:hypothetical protein